MPKNSVFVVVAEEKEPLGDLELKGVFKVVSDVWDEPVVKGVGVATSSDP